MDNLEETLKDLTTGDIEVTYLQPITTWRRVLNAARATIGRPKVSKDPKDSWKAKILLAEHSPIRLLEYDFGWKNIRQWVTAHLVRHHEGVEKFVHSQRADRRELPVERDLMPQGARNEMDMTCNAQAFINLSRKRMCMCASKETREAWNKVIKELRKTDPVLASKCVPECIYRGFCPEWMSDCKYHETEGYKRALANYRSTIYEDNIEWKQVPDYPLLEVANNGQIRENIKKDDSSNTVISILKPYTVIRNDQQFIMVKSECYNIELPIDALVALTWLSEELDREITYIERIDGNIWNNAPNNLKIHH